MIAYDTSALSDDDGTEVSGLLGFKMLRFLDIKIDYRDALVEAQLRSDAVEVRFSPLRWPSNS